MSFLCQENSCFKLVVLECSCNVRLCDNHHFQHTPVKNCSDFKMIQQDNNEKFFEVKDKLLRFEESAPSSLKDIIRGKDINITLDEIKKIKNKLNDWLNSSKKSARVFINELNQSDQEKSKNTLSISMDKLKIIERYEKNLPNKRNREKTNKYIKVKLENKEAKTDLSEIEMALSCIKTVGLENTNNFKNYYEIYGMDIHVSKYPFSPNSKFLVGKESQIHNANIWNIQKNKKEVIIKSIVRTNNIEKVCFSSKLKYLAIASRLVIIIYDLRDFYEVAIIHHDIHGRILDMCFSPDEQFLAFSSFSYILGIWDILKNNTHSSFEGLFHAISFSNNGKKILAHNHLKIEVWNVKGSKKYAGINASPQTIHSMIPSPDGKIIAIVLSGEMTHLWIDQTEIINLEDYLIRPYQVCFSKDGNLLASAEMNKTFTLWNIQSRKTEFKLEDSNHEIFTCESQMFLIDGYLITKSLTTLKIWNLKYQRIETQISVYVHKTFLSPDCSLLLCYNYKSPVRLMNIITTKDRSNASKDFFFIKSICYTRNHKFIVSENDRISVKVWKIVTRSEKSLSTPKSLDITSIYYPQFYELNAFLMTLEAVQTNKYSNKIIWWMKISNLEFTPLHFAAFEGNEQAVKLAVLTEPYLPIECDFFGRTPIYYSIIKKHQKITDILLKYLIGLNINIYNKARILWDLRKDMSEIVKNNSKYLKSFLDSIPIKNYHKLEDLTLEELVQKLSILENN